MPPIFSKKAFKNRNNELITFKEFPFKTKCVKIIYPKRVKLI